MEIFPSGIFYGSVWSHGPRSTNQLFHSGLGFWKATPKALLPGPKFSYPNFSSVQFSSVAQLCPTLCDPMDCSIPGLLVYHQFPELLKFMSIELVMPSSHLILCCPLLLPPSLRGHFRYKESSFPSCYQRHFLYQLVFLLLDILKVYMQLPGKEPDGLLSTQQA